MSQRFLREVMNIIIGKQGEEITEILDDKKYMNEFLIAKKLGVTINQMRNLLYKLSDHGLVSAIRKKDKRKGWYTYFWKIEVLKSLEFLREILSKKIDQLEHQIKSREAKRFYLCERCNVEYAEENALLHNFTCDECGSIFVLKDNTKMIKEFKRELENLKKQKKLINEEIEKEKEKIEKKKQKELKKEKKEKQKGKKKKILKEKKKIFRKKIKISKKKKSMKKKKPLKKAKAKKLLGKKKKQKRKLKRKSKKKK